MVYSIGYRRPPHRSVGSDASVSGAEKQNSIDNSLRSGSSGSMSQGIPDALSFDRIISGGTCPPVNLRDFMNYLKYIEHDAENLQFFLWARAYIKKFNELPENERKLSPAWTSSPYDYDSNGNSTPSHLKASSDATAFMKGTTFDNRRNAPEVNKEPLNPFSTPSRTPSEEQKDYIAPPSIVSSNGVSRGWESSTATKGSLSTDQHRAKAETAFEDAGLKWQPFTIQPFRDEIARIITIYISDGAPRQLNLSSKERAALLHALENTTHPTALRHILTTVEWSLRCQAHPNFIRWTICNGNRPRVIFARGLGIFGIVGGIIFGVLMTLSGAGRGWRVLALILFFIGISTLIAAIKGMCVVLHGMHHRHLRPWELFSDEDDTSVELKNGSFESLESTSTNSYEDEPWVAKYKERNIIRKIFDRELWIQEPALRQIQDTIFLQAVLGGLIGGAILTAIFVAVPAGHFY